MNTQTVIMVQIADRAWTLETLHCASVAARQQSAKIALIKLVPVQHLSWLGTDFGYLNMSAKDRQEIREYETMLEDDGVEFSTHLFQYATLSDAIVQAADYVNAKLVFATMPKSVIPFWHRWQLQDVRRHLAQNQRELIEHPENAQTPASSMVVSHI